jgi:hypothetical protein
MKIDFIAGDFTPGVLQTGEINVLWPDLVWAAITYGKSSAYPWSSSSGYARAERKYRAYLLYSCLKEIGGKCVKSEGYSSMDATEKGAASYFLGMTLAKLVAERLLSAPWLWHISCGSQALSFLNGKSRPDMLGRDLLGRWIVVEAKGRSGNLDMNALNSAKDQTRMVSTVNGALPYCRVGVQAYFDPDLRVYLLDPQPFDNAERVNFDVIRALDEYYGFRHLLRQFGKKRQVLSIEYLVIDEVELGIQIGLPEALVKDYDHIELTTILKGLPTRGADSLSLAPEQGLEEAVQSVRNIDSIRQLPSAGTPARNLSKSSCMYSDGFFIELDERWDDEKMALEPFERSKT